MSDANTPPPADTINTSGTTTINTGNPSPDAGTDPKLSPAAQKRQTEARVDILKKISEHPSFQAIDWTNRRKVIFRALYFIAAMLGLLTLSLCYITVRDIKVETNVTFLIGMIMTTLSVVAFAVIGSYVFGAQWDTNALRNSITDLAKNLKP